jgi:tRNA(Ile)-lysidine synthase
MVLVEKVTAMIRCCGLLSDGERVLVAVSGGPDSVALLHVLCELRDELRLELEVAHLQHGIRGEEAKEDARFVLKLADKLGLPIHLREIDLPQMKSETGKGNLEALARTERYRFFFEVARAQELQKIATAHTLGDQAETVLMWFLRGAGLKGSGGMAPLQELGNGTGEVKVIRPLLEVRKSEILSYLADSGIEFRVDRSNLEGSLLRNWIRLDLLPLLENRFGRRLPERLAHQGTIFRDEDAVLEGLAQKGLVEAGAVEGISRQKILAQPKALQRRILRLWIERTRGHLRGLDFVHIDDILRLIDQGPPQGRLSIPGGWELVREYDSLRVEKRDRSRSRICYDYPLKIGTLLRIPEANLELQSEQLAGPPEALPGDFMAAVFDLDRLDKDLSVRNFRHGDRFQPFGMAGHKKIKELFIEKRVPLSIRSTWPLLAAGPDIIWIPGYARSARAVVSTKTASVLHLKARRFEVREKQTIIEYK